MCHVLVLLLLAVSGLGSGVTLLKCCEHGYAVDTTLGDGTTCYRRDDTDWTPFIYSPRRQSFLPRGITPLHWMVKNATKPKCDDGVSVTVVPTHPDNSPEFIIFDNGSLWLQESFEFLHPESFCVDSAAALVCLYDDVPDMTSPRAGDKGATANINMLNSGVPRKKVRIKKCCGEGAVYSESAASCVSFPDNATVARLTSVLPPGLIDNVTTVLASGFPVCTSAPGGGFVVVGVLGGGDGVIKADGSLHLLRAAGTLKPVTFCLEHVVERPTERAAVFACPGGLAPVTWRNAGTSSAMEGDVRFALYPVGLCLSVLFLAATLAAGCLLPGAHHALHWRCQTAHVACLMIGDLLLAATQLVGHAGPSAACTIVAVFMHFFFLSAFFWLNTMCFNIWWTFRDLRPASLDKAQEVCRLRLYELYAWGGPLFIATVAVIIDNLPEGSSSSLLRPRFGHQRCWFYGDAEIFSYFYGPVGMLLGVNLILFAATARELACGLWKREVIKSNTERAALGRVCLKLVVVMGLTWVADVISWAVGGPQFIWYFTDLINALQGVFIFAVIGCQPQVWAAVNRLWCWRVPRPGTTNMAQHLSSYSQGLPSLDSAVLTPINKNTPLETLC